MRKERDIKISFNNSPWKFKVNVYDEMPQNATKKLWNEEKKRNKKLKVDYLILLLDKSFSYPFGFF